MRRGRLTEGVALRWWARTGPEPGKTASDEERALQQRIEELI